MIVSIARMIGFELSWFNGKWKIAAELAALERHPAGKIAASCGEGFSLIDKIGKWVSVASKLETIHVSPTLDRDDAQVAPLQNLILHQSQFCFTLWAQFMQLVWLRLWRTEGPWHPRPHQRRGLSLKPIRYGNVVRLADTSKSSLLSSAMSPYIKREKESWLLLSMAFRKQ